MPSDKSILLLKKNHFSESCRLSFAMTECHISSSLQVMKHVKPGKKEYEMERCRIYCLIACCFDVFNWMIMSESGCHLCGISETQEAHFHRHPDGVELKMTDVVVNVMDDKWILKKHRFRVVKVLMFQKFLISFITVFIFL